MTCFQCPFLWSRNEATAISLLFNHVLSSGYHFKAHDVSSVINDKVLGKDYLLRDLSTHLVGIV